MSRAGVEYMGFWIRAAAFVADWIFAYLLAALIAAIIGISLTSGDVEPETMQEVQFTLENFNYSFLLLFCGISAVHGIIMTALKGQTLGKMLLRIQVVDADGKVPPWPRTAVRETLRGVILLALFPLGLLYIWVAMDAQKRGPHDYIARSYVIRKRRGAEPPGASCNTQATECLLNWRRNPRFCPAHWGSPSEELWLLPLAPPSRPAAPWPDPTK